MSEVPLYVTTQRATTGDYGQILGTFRYLVRRNHPMFLRYCLPWGIADGRAYKSFSNEPEVDSL